MTRIAMGVEYDGGGYAGWEAQRVHTTVQGCLEKALSKVADHPIRVVCAGRTDSGVHGLGQVIHTETHAKRDVRAWVLGGNVNLPRDIRVQWAHPVPGDFHARFSARSRHYRYVILNRRIRSALQRGRVTWEHRPLDDMRMQVAADFLLGEHDFSAYRAVACQSPSAVRRIHRLEVRRQGEMLTIDVVANAFLHHMVRNIAGMLIAVGNGSREPRWAEEILHSRDRRSGGVTAPPDGLYLMAVEYPDRYRIPKVSSQIAVC